MRKFFRIAFYFGVTALFLVIAIAGFTQTRYFRAYLRNVVLEKYPEFVRAKLDFDRIEGNLVTGLQIYNISLKEDSANVFSAERIEVKYNPTGFLLGRISFNRLTAFNPRIHAWRSIDGTWNTDRMTIPGSKDTTKGAAIVDIKNIELVNARISFEDSLKLHERVIRNDPDPPIGAVDYARTNLEQLNLAASIRIEPLRVSGQIHKLSFVSHRPSFSLTRFTADVSLTPSLADVNNLVIETKNSALKGDVQVKNIDVVHIGALKDFERAPVQMNLDIQRLSSKELKGFLYPYVDFLDRSFSLQLKASGTFGRLSVDRLTIKTPKSTVQAQGTILNLHKPQDLELEIACIDNTLDPDDVAELMPGLGLPNLRFLGGVNYDLVFSGRPTDFTVHLNGQTDPGAFQLEGSLQIQKTLQYRAALSLRDVDLGLLAQDDKLKSRIFGKVSIDGSGTNLRSMRTIARVEIDTSSVAEMPLSRTVAVLDMSDANLRSHFTSTWGNATYDFSGRVQFHKDSSSFQVAGKIGSLDLAQILKNPTYESDLSMALNVVGTWIDENRVQSRLNVEAYRSSFNKLPIDSASVLVEYDARDTSLQNLMVTSNIGDVLAKGNFSLGSLVGNLRDGVEILTKAMEYRLRNLDSLRAFAPLLIPRSPKFHLSLGSQSKFTEANVDIKIHDLYPLGVFFRQPLRGNISAKMNIRGDVDDMMSVGEAVSSDFSFSSSSIGLAGQNIRVTWDLSGISRDSILTTLGANVDISSDFLSVNNTLLSTSTLSLRMEGNEGTYTLSTLIDSTAKVNVSGSYEYRGSVYRLEVDELKLGFGSLVYENSDPLNLVAGIDGLQFKSFSVHHEAEELVADGFFNPAGVSDVDVSLKGFLLNNLRLMLKPSKQPQVLKSLGGIVSGRALLRGSFEYPNVSLDFVADGLRYGETVFGQAESRLSYFEHMLTIFGSYRYNPQDASASPDLLLSGSVPYEFSLTASHHHQPQGQIDLQLQSKGVRLDLLSPLIPLVSNLSGTLSCDMKMKGSTDAPEYDGSLSLSSARFLFLPLNIQYILNGKFVSNKNSIALQDVTVKNIEQDQSLGKGSMNISGNFILQGLKLGEFDLLANGQLLLMKELSRPRGSKFYGDLFAATGPSGIRWNGTLSSSHLSGEVDIRNGKVTLPPERETVLLTSKNISIVFTDDTSRARPASKNTSEVGKSLSPLLAMNAPAKGLSGAIPAPSASDATNDEQVQEAESGSFLDNIQYDLIIETQGPTQLRLIVNPITNEELFADLKGRLAFEKRGAQARLNGEVEVGNRSYYNYFKRFDATGRLSFTGNPLNPELNITGRYEGIHRKLADTTGGMEEKVRVTLDISGTRNEPKLRFDLETENNGKYEKNKGDVESDAIAFLLSGQYRDELTRAQRTALIGENLIGITSGVLSGPLREYLRKETGVSLDVLYYGGATFEQSTDIRLSGEIGDAVVRFGGRVFSNLNNTNVSVELPMSSILGTESWRNLILTLERRVEGLETVEEARSSRGARLLYRINF